MNPNAILLIDGARGIHIPATFMQRWSQHIVDRDKSLIDWDTLNDQSYSFGEDFERDDQLWQEMLDDTVIQLGDKRYTLWHDEDLWAIPEGEEAYPDED